MVAQLTQHAARLCMGKPRQGQCSAHPSQNRAALAQTLSHHYTCITSSFHTPFGSEGTCKGLLVQPPAINKDILNYIMQLRAPSNLTMDVSTYGPLTTSLGNLIRCFPILIIKSFFLVSSEPLNLPHNKPHELEETLKTVLKYRDGDVTQEEGGSEGNGL